MMRSFRRWVCLGTVLLGAVVGCNGCDDEALQNASADAGAMPGGLSPEQAAKVVAKVGDREITLGDVARTLENMNNHEKEQYRTKERRRVLLQEMIDAELLAQEARRRGLDERPEVVAAVRQRLREAQAAKIKGPQLASIPISEIRKHYDDNIDRYREPERREALTIRLNNEAEAREVLEAATSTESTVKWRDLVLKHTAQEKRPTRHSTEAPNEFVGSLGLVGPPGVAKGDNPRVPEAVRTALFALDKQGDVFAEIVKSGDAFYVVRMGAKTDAHTTSFDNAKRGIRMLIAQRMTREREEAAVEELKKRFAVTIDEQALESVKLPPGLSKYKPLWDKP